MERRAIWPTLSIKLINQVWTKFCPQNQRKVKNEMKEANTIHGHIFYFYSYCDWDCYKPHYLYICMMDDKGESIYVGAKSGIQLKVEFWLETQTRVG